MNFSSQFLCLNYISYHSFDAQNKEVDIPHLVSSLCVTYVKHLKMYECHCIWLQKTKPLIYSGSYL